MIIVDAIKTAISTAIASALDAPGERTVVVVPVVVVVTNNQIKIDKEQETETKG